MRLRVIAQDRVVEDLKLSKRDKTSIDGAVEALQQKRDEWELQPISFTIADVVIDGILKGVERTSEGGEEIIVFRF